MASEQLQAPCTCSQAQTGLNHRAITWKTQQRVSESVCVSAYVDKSAGSVPEWERACLPAGHLGGGGPGSPSRATTATTAQPALLAAQIGGGCGWAQEP